MTQNVVHCIVYYVASLPFFGIFRPSDNLDTPQLNNYLVLAALSTNLFY